ncbi:hypothetical protein TNCT_308461 [Trichonephila clavata]|uniref:Uncharacterized protein n=1 Tax=Trichonephila clavata TaxID=2740835 RepID=A0A8X6L4L8_TRICU|nr:hypothetical protein TNCT_308461 [Trichonephila clavata]
MASVRKRIAWDRRTVHIKALNLANKVAGLISEIHNLEWDIPDLDEDDLTDFLSNDGLHVWRHFLTFAPIWRKNIKYSPKFWVMTAENFESCVYVMMQETIKPQENFEKVHLYSIFALIFVIATWFIEHNTENMMNKVIEVAYRITFRIFNSTPIYGSSW